MGFYETKYIEMVDKQMPFVKAVRQQVFPEIPVDQVYPMYDFSDGYDGIGFGGYNFCITEDEIETIAGKRKVIRWVLSAYAEQTGGHWELDDLCEKEIGQFNSVADCLAEIGRIEYKRKIDEVGMGLAMAECGEDDVYGHLEAMKKEGESRCPHGLNCHECDACMILGDQASDAYREDQMKPRHIGP